jgi:CRP-like cAMP-binding protein/ATP/ADP translocase/HEAT repeat protein
MAVPLGFFRKLFDIRPEETKAFGWVSGLMFLILSSQILFANFADTAFIKRFGVQYLPNMFLIDAVVVFFAMDVIRGLLGRYSAIALLTRVFVVFAGIEVACRFLILLNISLLYPFMFILRQQFDGVILIIFWNICNDIFDTRQSKRIFPLITAGGIIGRVIGSFSTNFLARTMNIDNLLLISAGLLLLAAVTNHRIGRLFPSPMAAPGPQAATKKGWFSPIAGIKEMRLLATGSLLFLILAAIRVLPNIVGPMFDFQYGVILSETFPTEEGLAQFYGTFRGVLNIITFLVLLFIGKVHTRVGIPNALLFRPGNYFFVFSLLLLHFDILIGIYARISITVFTTTLHNPANNIIINLFPDQIRAKMRPVLQMVSRAGSLVGSLILLGLKGFIHPKYFSLFGLFFAGAWILVTLRLRSNYSSFLLESLLDKQVDLGELKEMDLTVLVQDKKTLNRLLDGLREEKGEAAILCARILAEARYPKIGEAILSVIGEKEMPVQVELFNLLPPEEARPLVPRLIEMAETAPPWLLVHLVRAVGRLAPTENIDFLSRSCEVDEKAVQAEAIVGFYQAGMESEGLALLSKWLESRDPEDLLLTVTTVARTREVKLADRLYTILEREKDPRIQAKTLEALGALDVSQRNERIIPWLDSAGPEVRQAAVSALALEEEEALERAIDMLGDESPDVREEAMERIHEIGKGIAPVLLKSLTSPKRKVKDGILRLLERLEVKDVEFSEFITREMRQAYEMGRAVLALLPLKDKPAISLLIRHLRDRGDDAMFTVFRILEFEGEASRIRTIYKGLKGATREKANALEALEHTVNPSLSRILIPLADDIPLEEKVAFAQKEFGLSTENLTEPSAVLAELLDSDDMVTQVCTAYAIGEERMESFSEKLGPLEARSDEPLRETTTQALKRIRDVGQDEIGKRRLSTMDKVVQLRGVYIFSDLQVRELIAIGSVTVERECPKDEIVITEGETGDTMFLILTGEFFVIQNQGGEKEALVATITEGDYFGEMALFEGKPRANTVKANTDAKLLVLGKREFDEIMRHFPQIPINICRVFSHRIRESEKKIHESGEPG